MGNLIEIQACEERLKMAMLHADVSALDELISSDLLFTNHLGQLMNKEDDLAMHQSGVLVISRILLSEQKIKLYDAIAIVSVQARITASFNGEHSENNFRFTRVWSKQFNETWQIVNGHSSVIV